MKPNKLPRVVYFVDKYSNQVRSCVLYGEFFDPEDGICLDVRSSRFVGLLDSFEFIPDDNFVEDW